MSTHFDQIDYYFKELTMQEGVYQPGYFWKAALAEIASSFNETGISSFRKAPVNLNFFIPTYGPPGNGFEIDRITSFLESLGLGSNLKQKQFAKLCFDGSMQALADYRTFIASNNIGDNFDLLSFSESDVGSPQEHFKFNDNYFSRSSLNYLLGLSYLKKVAPHFVPRKVLEIGGGFGTLGEIIFKSKIADFKYIDLDLPPMFLIARDYLKACIKKPEFFFVEDYNASKELGIDNLPQISCLPNWYIKRLRGDIDLFVNFISFQEMEPDIVENYANQVIQLRPTYVLLRNLREGKQVSKNGSLGVKRPILKNYYISYFKGYTLVGSNVCPFGYETVDGFHSELLVLEKNG